MTNYNIFQRLLHIARGRRTTPVPTKSPDRSSEPINNLRDKDVTEIMWQIRVKGSMRNVNTNVYSVLDKEKFFY